MRRFLSTLSALPIFVMGGLVGASAAHADDFVYSGRLLTTYSSEPIAGVQVVATAPLGAPSVVAVTAADGTWSFTSPDDEFSLQFTGNPDYQGGWYDSCVSNLYLQPASGCTNGPGVVPDLYLFATWATGRILDSVSLTGVGGAVVEARWPDGVTPIASATTNAAGEYRIDGLATDEIALFVNGVPAGHSSGYFGCVAIVATFPEACTFAPGPQGDRPINPVSVLSAPRAAFGFSLRRGAITTFFVAPASGTSVGYELTCTGRIGTPVVRTLSAPLQTRSGFESGRNRCTLRALGATGPGPSTAPFTVYVW
jgi:hypothetical protein